MRLKQRLISKEEKILRRFVILAIAVTGLLAFGATTASAAANFKSQSFSVNNQGKLVCSFDVSGLGNVSSTQGSCTATSTAVYQCINNGGKNPAAGNKHTSTGETGHQQTIPVHNGRAQGDITVDPAGGDYLSRMCDRQEYHVIGDARELPASLAELYAVARAEARRGGSHREPHLRPAR